MLLSEFLLKAEKITIEQADNGLFYLEPTWKLLLNDNQLSISNVTDRSIDENELEDILKLEVKKRNVVNTLKPYVLSWVHDVITSTVEPAIMQEETDYIKNLVEYMKVKQTQQE